MKDIFNWDQWEKLDRIFIHSQEIGPENSLYYRKRSSPYVDLTYLYLLSKANNVIDVIEIGTYHGLSSCFLALGCKGKVYTINNSLKEIKVAEKLANSLNIQNIEFHYGDSLEVIPKLLQRNITFNLGYIDGNHSYKYAMGEYELILKSIDRLNGAIIFDDAEKIHPDGLTDGGVPRVIQELEIKTCSFLDNRFAVKTFGGFKLL